MGEQLYVVVFKRRVETKTKTGKTREKWERSYRAPRPEDGNLANVRSALDEKLVEWEALDLVPTESRPPDLGLRSPRSAGTSLRPSRRLK